MMRLIPSQETSPGFRLCLCRSSLWDHMRSGRLGRTRGKQRLGLSSPALAPKEAGPQEWQCKKQSWGALTTSCSPQYCNCLSFFRTLLGCALLHTLAIVFGVFCRDGDTEFSGCFQLPGRPCLSVMLATSLQPLAGLQQAPHPLSAFLTLFDI